VGWPGEPTSPEPPEPPEPSPPAPEPASTAQRRDLGTRPDTTVELPRQPAAGDFAGAVQDYRARSAQARPARPPYQLAPERPGTVTAAAVILFVSAGLGLLACCGLNLLAGEATLGDDEQNVLLLVSAIIVVFSLFNGVLGYYVLQGRQWARITTIVLCVIGILTSVVSLFATIDSTGGSNSLGTCFGIVLNIVIIGLLSGESAGSYFRHARG
jgi:hypothetical protein